MKVANSYLNKKQHNKYDMTLNYKSCILRFGVFGIKSSGYGLLTESKVYLFKKLLVKKLKAISKSYNSVKL